MTWDIERALDDSLNMGTAGRLESGSGLGEAELSELLAIAADLRGRLTVLAPDPVAKARIYGEFLTAARQRAAAKKVSSSLPFKRLAYRARLAVAGGLALVLMTSGTVYAASGVMPDSPLYPVKRALEQIELLANRNETSRARFGLELAEKRLEEIGYLMRTGPRRAIGDLLASEKASVGQATRLLRSAKIDKAERDAIGRYLKQFQATEKEKLNSLRLQADRRTRTIIDQHLDSRREAAGSSSSRSRSGLTSHSKSSQSRGQRPAGAKSPGGVNHRPSGHR